MERNKKQIRRKDINFTNINSETLMKQVDKASDIKKQPSGKAGTAAFQEFFETDYTYNQAIYELKLRGFERVSAWSKDGEILLDSERVQDEYSICKMQEAAIRLAQDKPKIVRENLSMQKEDYIKLKLLLEDISVGFKKYFEAALMQVLLENLAKYTEEEISEGEARVDVKNKETQKRFERRKRKKG